MDLDAAIRRGLEKAKPDLLKAAQHVSSGPYSTRLLRRMDHPYARRHGKARLDPAVINRQSGMFFGGWHVEDGPDLSIRAVNETPQTEILRKGTKFMFQRPFAERIEREAEPAIVRHIEREIAAELRRG